MSFDERHLKDPACFQENRLAAHSDHIAYAGMEELARGESSLRWPLDVYKRQTLYGTALLPPSLSIRVTPVTLPKFMPHALPLEAPAAVTSPLWGRIMHTS